MYDAWYGVLSFGKWGVCKLRANGGILCEGKDPAGKFTQVSISQEGQQTTKFETSDTYHLA